MFCHDMARMSQSTKKKQKTKWHVCPVKTPISLCICLVWSDSLLCAQCVAKNQRRLQAGSADSDQTLGGCPGWSESLQGTHSIWFVMSCSGSYVYYDWCYSLYLHRTIEFISFFQSRPCFVTDELVSPQCHFGTIENDYNSGWQAVWRILSVNVMCHSDSKKEITVQ